MIYDPYGRGLGDSFGDPGELARTGGKFGPMPPSKLEMRSVGNLEGRVKILAGLVREGLRDPRMRHLAVSLVQQCPDRNDGCEVASIFYFAKSNIRYTGDITDIDTYQTAARTLQFGGGDCDDSATVLATLLGELGFQCGFRVVSTTGKSWEHIYAIVGLPKRAPKGVLPLDITVPSSYPGWEPKGQIKASKDFYPISTTG